MDTVVQSATSTVPSGAGRLNALGAARSKPFPHTVIALFYSERLRAAACIPGC
ncbi:hypothetical protein ABZV34_33480 [Streptomyces sp. NPDC005195]|uniref:hypothetical protein n=1 Tax=Streptomyces sp. NPDC005195 TaxID=3154561 RepID=UPI0033BA9348